MKRSSFRELTPTELNVAQGGIAKAPDGSPMRVRVGTTPREVLSLMQMVGNVDPAYVPPRPPTTHVNPPTRHPLEPPVSPITQPPATPNPRSPNPPSGGHNPPDTTPPPRHAPLPPRAEIPHPPDLGTRSPSRPPSEPIDFVRLPPTEPIDYLRVPPWSLPALPPKGGFTPPAPSVPPIDGPTTTFEDGSKLTIFDDGSTLAIGTDGSVSSTPSTDAPPAPSETILV